MNSYGEATRGADYTERLQRVTQARWKQVLNVQAPYRWNIRRLQLGHTLDVGCGIGRVLSSLADGVGVDHNAESIQVARDAGLRAWSTAEWPDCPDAVPGSFDSMLMAHVLEHLQRDEADEIIASYLPYLKPLSRIVFICPQEKGFTTDDTHVRFVDADEMAATAARFGFETLRSYSFPLPRAAGKVFPYNEFVVVAGRRPAD